MNTSSQKKNTIGSVLLTYMLKYYFVYNNFRNSPFEKLTLFFRALVLIFSDLWFSMLK